MKLSRYGVQNVLTADELVMALYDRVNVKPPISLAVAACSCRIACKAFLETDDEYINVSDHENYLRWLKQSITIMEAFSGI